MRARLEVAAQHLAQATRLPQRDMEVSHLLERVSLPCELLVAAERLTMASGRIG